MLQACVQATGRNGPAAVYELVPCIFWAHAWTSADGIDIAVATGSPVEVAVSDARHVNCRMSGATSRTAEKYSVTPATEKSPYAFEVPSVAFVGPKLQRGFGQPPFKSILTSHGQRRTLHHSKALL